MVRLEYAGAVGGSGSSEPRWIWVPDSGSLYGSSEGKLRLYSVRTNQAWRSLWAGLSRSTMEVLPIVLEYGKASNEGILLRLRLGQTFMEMKNPAADLRLRGWIRTLGSRYGNLREWPSCGCKAVYGYKGGPEIMVDDRRVALPGTWERMTCVIEAETKWQVV